MAKLWHMLLCWLGLRWEVEPGHWEEASNAQSKNLGPTPSPASAPVPQESIPAQDLKLVEVSGAEAQPNRVSRSAQQNAKRSKRKSAGVQRHVKAQRIGLSGSVINSKELCWRATGTRVRNGDPLIYAPDLDRAVPLIRVIYASVLNEEPPRILRCGCGLQGDARLGCVNPFDHHAENGFIFVRINRENVLTNTRDIILTSHIPPTYPSIKRTSPDDETSAAIADIQKIWFKLLKLDHYRSEGIKDSDIAAHSNGRYTETQVRAILHMLSTT